MFQLPEPSTGDMNIGLGSPEVWCVPVLEDRTECRGQRWWDGVTVMCPTTGIHDCGGQGQRYWDGDIGLGTLSMACSSSWYYDQALELCMRDTGIWTPQCPSPRGQD